MKTKKQKVTFIYVNGKTSEYEMEQGDYLDVIEIEKFVKGYAERININSDNYMYINDDTINNEFPINLKASSLLDDSRTICGNAILIETNK